jgi:hypothetical protein
MVTLDATCTEGAHLARRHRGGLRDGAQPHRLLPLRHLAVHALTLAVAPHGEGLPHKHEHRLDEGEIKPRHWFTRTGLTNGRHSKLHTALPSLIVASSCTAASACFFASSRRADNVSASRSALSLSDRSVSRESFVADFFARCSETLRSYASRSRS